MTYIFDIDNTICKTKGSDYVNAIPINKRIKKVNQLHYLGHIIILKTCRGATSGIDWESLTRKQLQDWGIKYHKLLMWKVFYDKIIDDRAENSDSFFR